MARALAAEVETFPEADRLDGAPHPRFTTQLHGHGEAERTLASGLASGTLHHGWLLAGAAGIGKATLAWRFARAALSQADERGAGGTLAVADDTRGSRQVRALAHPGLLVLRRPYLVKDKRFAASIPIDEVRRLRQFLALGSEQGGWRVVIVDTADDLAPAAANAILKSLEEPPPRTVFVLITSEPGRLLPTIRSRCRFLPMARLSQEDLTRALTGAVTSEGGKLPTAAEWTTLFDLAGGSVRRALALHRGGGVALQATVTAQMAALPKVDWAAAHTLADKLAPAAGEQQYDLYVELLSAAVARLVRAAATGAGHDVEVTLARRVIGADRLVAFAAAWEAIERTRAEADLLNLDRRGVVLGALATLERAAR
jgi:DNA polymerase-3 subunit delta'